MKIIKMEKRIVEEVIDDCIYWAYGISISQIREELDILEKKGATDINISLHSDYNGGSYIDIAASKKRLETDEEFKNRTQKEATNKHLQEQGELKLLAELKAKYEK